MLCEPRQSRQAGLAYQLFPASAAALPGGELPPNPVSFRQVGSVNAPQTWQYLDVLRRRAIT